MLCNPHNPVGRLFARPELEKLAQICLSRDVVICADEIHCGLVLGPGKRHLPIATLSPEVAQRTITLMAPSKTFNLAGLGCAFAVIPSEALRQSFLRAKAGIVPMINPYGYLAAQAAYRHREAWRQELVTYLRCNRDLLAEALPLMPGALSMAPVEATYLAWIDISEVPGSVIRCVFSQRPAWGCRTGANLTARVSSASTLVAPNPGCAKQSAECMWRLPSASTAHKATFGERFTSASSGVVR